MWYLQDPNSDAIEVARPSPTSVRCKPGSARKLRPTVDDMAHMSPICSTIVARAMGMMVMMAETRSPQSGLAKTAKAVSFMWNGTPIHAASRTAVKSTCPHRAATT